MTYISKKNEAKRKGKEMQEAIQTLLKTNGQVTLLFNDKVVAILDDNKNLAYDISFSYLFNHYILRIINSNQYIMQVYFTSIKQEVLKMWCIYSYKGYTISHNASEGVCYITYPNDVDYSVKCKSLKMAYYFIDTMEKCGIKRG